MTPVQYRIMEGRTVSASDGPDDAEVTIAIGRDIALSEGFEADVEFMRGRLKVSGPTSAVFAALRSGDATETLVRLASPS